jgi:phytoene/squalene synthetase
MMNTTLSPRTLAPTITKTASQQTYYTIRFLVDRERVADAYRAYAYFRWVDDTLDGESMLDPERMSFLGRQKSLLETCYRGETTADPTLEEHMLIDLVQHDRETNSGLQSYLRNMMQVMEFDARRRGRWISQTELGQYTHWLASAVTEAMHSFIGQRCYSPHDDTRYLAVTGAHITHMLRDTLDDVQAGYYNIPREILEAGHMRPQDIENKAYRAWVQSRVQLARKCFNVGKTYLARVQNSRCRLAGLAYTARFEWLLDTIEREGYLLRPQYQERKSLMTGWRMVASIFSSLIGRPKVETFSQPIVSQSLRKFKNL